MALAMIIVCSAIVPVPMPACFGAGQGKLVPLNLVHSWNVLRGRC